MGRHLRVDGRSTVVVRSAVSLGIGLTLCIGIAMIPTLYQIPWRNVSQTFPNERPRVIVASSVLATRVFFPVRTSDYTSKSIKTIDPSCIRWSTLIDVPRVGTGDVPTAQQASGWPLRCLCWTAYEVESPRTVAGEWRLASSEHEVLHRIPDGLTLRGERHNACCTLKALSVVPMRPLVGGLILNSLMYAMLVNAACWLCTRLRQGHRAAHARCMTCGYSLWGLQRSLCPECGAPQSRTDR